MASWQKKRVLIVVRTYPVPAQQGIEVSCTAGVTPEGKWIRIFPVPYRFLEADKRFKKYQWIEADVIRAQSDARPESHKVNIETIAIGDSVSTADGWRSRRDLLGSLIRPSLCAIKREQEQTGHPTLGLFRPSKIEKLVIKPVSENWTTGQKAILSQQMLGFEKGPTKTLEKLPIEVSYKFQCVDRDCKGHQMQCTDWEMGEAYRAYLAKYGNGWEMKFREKFEREMIEKFDTHFFVGTVHNHPKNWIIVGLFYPPKTREPDLFDSRTP